MADISSTDEGIPSPQMGGTQGGAANALAAREARKNTKYEEFFAAKAKNLVKGVGHVSNNGVPLSDVSHGGGDHDPLPRHDHEDPRRHDRRRVEHR